MSAMLETIWFLIAILPTLILREGLNMLAPHVGEEDWIGVLPYFFVVVLSLLLIILLALGFR